MKDMHFYIGFSRTELKETSTNRRKADKILKILKIGVTWRQNKTVPCSKTPSILIANVRDTGKYT